MTDTNQKQLGKTLWNIADQLRGAMNADDFRDYMLSFLFLRYLSDNYEIAAKKELGKDYPGNSKPDGLRRSASMQADMVAERREPSGVDRRVPLAVWYDNNPKDVRDFEKQMRRKVHYVIQPSHLWNSIASMDEIEKNDFNLNISRYISTALSEQEISLEAAHADLVKIENAIQKATAKHNEFLKELGKPLLPSA